MNFLVYVYGANIYLLVKLGKAGTEALYTLATNKTLFRYEEADQERIVMQAKRLLDFDEIRCAEEKILFTSKDGRLGQLLAETDCWKFIVRTLSFETHFQSTPVLTPKWLRENLVHIHGGVCAFFYSYRIYFNILFLGFASHC